jgi:hypothetical protein
MRVTVPVWPTAGIGSAAIGVAVGVEVGGAGVIVGVGVVGVSVGVGAVGVLVGGIGVFVGVGGNRGVCRRYLSFNRQGGQGQGRCQQSEHTRVRASKTSQSNLRFLGSGIRSLTEAGSGSQPAKPRILGSPYRLLRIANVETTRIVLLPAIPWAAMDRKKCPT